MKKDTQILITPTPYFLGELYDKYAGMLLGYINDIVRDNELAEKHLILIYSSLPTNYKDTIPEGENVWCHLQRLAKKHLAGFEDVTKAALSCKDANFTDLNNRNKFFKLMSIEQKEVFCGIYHYGKTINQLSQELKTTEDFIRKTVKEAFAIIKQAS